MKTENTSLTGVESPQEDGASNRGEALFFLVLIALFAVPHLATAQNLVTNGDFENAPTNPWNTPYKVGYTGITGWTLGASTTDTSNALTYINAAGSTTYDGGGYPISSSGFTLVSPAGGQYFIMDADPYYNANLNQNITGLVVGNQYNVSFYQALFVDPVRGQTGTDTAYWSVALGATTQTSALMTDSPAAGGSNWQLQNMTFTATATSEVLSFIAIGTGVPPNATLDGVSMAPVVVPEPGGALLVGVVGAMTLFRRRRR